MKKIASNQNFTSESPKKIKRFVKKILAFQKECLFSLHYKGVQENLEPDKQSSLLPGTRVVDSVNYRLHRRGMRR